MPKQQRAREQDNGPSEELQRQLPGDEQPLAPPTLLTTITTERPDEMWGTDATACLTTREGNATVFIAVDPWDGKT